MAIPSRTGAILAVLLSAAVTACASGASPGPLALESLQEGMTACAPNPGADHRDWGAPIGSPEETYYDQASAPITIEAVTLLDPHNLVLHGSVLYEMVHDAHSLAIGAPWSQQGQFGLTFTLKAENGIAIDSIPGQKGCDADQNAIQSAWAAGK
jgi:CelD/BcsL family acetyltransferase involved in cellulose biosynthesis